MRRCIMMFFGWLLAVLGFGALAYKMGWHKPRDHRDPMDILNERYARGDISREEYQIMREDLES
jgi:uncharacterized membrane protein